MLLLLLPGADAGLLRERLAGTTPPTMLFRLYPPRPVQPVFLGLLTPQICCPRRAPLPRARALECLAPECTSESGCDAVCLLCAVASSLRSKALRICGGYARSIRLSATASFCLTQVLCFFGFVYLKVAHSFPEF
eukprot:1521001-Rhodomonas_salina.1